MRVAMEDSVNVLGEPLKACSFDPVTGFFRDGCCNTGPADRGRHTVCVRMTAEFLAFSERRGNHLGTPRPEFGFPGFAPATAGACARTARARPGPPASRRRWCSSTHRSVLETIPLDVLRAHAMPGRAPQRH